LVKKRTKTHPKYINPTVEGLGQLIDSGELTAHCHEYLRTYASATDTTVGGVAPVFLATADDLSNNTGQYQFAYTGGSPPGPAPPRRCPAR
jgi:hypothetical protein